MTTVIVFQEDCILAAMGKEGIAPVLTQTKRIALQGSTDVFARWEQALMALGPEWKAQAVRVVLPVGMSSNRVLQVPYGRKKQLREMAGREVKNSFRGEIADYSVAYQDQKKGIDLCAGGADEGVLKHVIKMCEEAGVSIDGITVPMEGYLHILNETSRSKKQTAIYLFFEEGSMISVLCQDGRYLYSSRSRLFSERGTLDFGTEIVRSISGILQSFAGSRRELEITQVYYAGCPKEDFEVSIEGIERMNLQVRPLEEQGEDLLDWLPCIGAMMWRSHKEKRIDLYKALTAATQEESISPKLWKHMRLPGALFGVCLLVFGVLTGIRLKQSQEIHKVQEWIDSAEVQAQYQEASALNDRLLEIEGGIKAVEQMKENLSVYPELSSEVFDRMERAGGVDVQLEISGYDAETGLLVFETSSREVIDVPSYILRLQQTGLFHKVDYTGYAYENEWYTLSLSCIMEGKEAGGGT